MKLSRRGFLLGTTALAAVPAAAVASPPAYGVSQASRALPDLMLLNRVRRAELMAAERAMFPPMIVGDSATLTLDMVHRASDLLARNDGPPVVLLHRRQADELLREPTLLERLRWAAADFFNREDDNE